MCSYLVLVFVSVASIVNVIADKDVSLEARFRQMEEEIGQLRKHVQRQDVFIRHQAEVNRNLHEQIAQNNLTRSLRSTRSRSAAAFTAIMDNVILSQAPNKPVIFNIALLNDGGAYSTRTGIFTAPRGGVYLFSYSMHVNRDTQSFLQLVKNGARIVGAVAESEVDLMDSQGGNTAAIGLYAGDRVWVEVFHDSHDRIEGKYGGTSFTGVLIE